VFRTMFGKAMFGKAVFALLIVTTTAAPALAQEWANKIFATKSHDFGSVARASKTEFAFEITNRYKETIHIASVRTSCGCTTPRIVKQTLKSREKGAIIAKFNTRSFTGNRSATITVTIDQPYFAEVQLEVKGHIRTDIVINPGQVQFGDIDHGTGAERTITLEYAGRDDWKITDVRSANDHYEVSMKETKRGGGKVGYSLTVRLKDTAPVGFLNDSLILVTNDRRSRQFPVAVAGKVVSPVSVSPASLQLGTLKPGQQVTKRLIVRSKKPFKILDIACDDKSFKFESADESKTLHIIPITYTAGDNAGKIAEKIKIRTDLGDELITSLLASGTVKIELKTAAE